MKLYEKTVVPEKHENEPRPTDPMELKLWLHDQKMRKRREEEERIEKMNAKRVITGIPGNTIDGKLYQYYEEF